MVQLTNALLVAAAVAPAFAAPLEAREPRISGSQVKKVGKVLGHVASGVGTAATVGSFFVPQQQRRSLEAREPFIKHHESFAPIFHSTPILRREDTLEAREPRGGARHFGPREVDIEARDPNFFSTVIKDVGKVAKFVIRDDADSLEAREPRFGGGGHGHFGGHFGGRPAPGGGIEAREDIIEAREPRFGHGHFGGHFGGRPAPGGGMEAREDSIEAREPRFGGGHGHFGGHFGGRPAPGGGMEAREDIIEAREPAFGGGGRGHFSGRRHVPSGGMEAREDSIEAREPRFGGGHGHFGGHFRGRPAPGGGMEAREDSIEARDPNFFSTIVKDVGKVAKFVIREDESGDLYARDYSDEYYLD